MSVDENENPYLTKKDDLVIWDFIGNEDLLDQYDPEKPLSHIEVQAELNKRRKQRND